MFEDFYILIDYWPEIWKGIQLTLLVWLAGMFLGMIMGLLIAILQIRASKPIAMLIVAMNTVLRGTPFLILLFILYYGGPFIGLVLDPLTAGILGLAVYSAAYFSEIFRSGFLALPKGQIEAANMFGFSKFQTLIRVSLPQMMIVIFPALVNMMIILVKETSIVSVISVSELTATLSTIGSDNFSYVPTLTFLALFYWGMLEALALWANRVEVKLSRYLTR